MSLPSKIKLIKSPLRQHGRLWAMLLYGTTILRSASSSPLALAFCSTPYNIKRCSNKYLLQHRQLHILQQLNLQKRNDDNAQQDDNTDDNVSTTSNITPLPFLPLEPNAMVRQASSAISQAFLQEGINLQTIRLPLSESMYSNKEEGFVADRALGWQGGPQETYRYLYPLSKELLQRIEAFPLTRLPASSDNDDDDDDRPQQQSRSSGLLPRIQEQILLDFDGSALLTAECPLGPLGDVQALLQPNTDKYYMKTIASVEELFSDTPGKLAKRLFLLVNPAWRDKSSWGLFGGAQKAQIEILDRYEVTYALDQFVIRGQKMSLLKVWPHDWCVFLTPITYNNNNNNDEEVAPKARLLGSFQQRPDYHQMEDLVKVEIDSRRKKGV